MYKQKRFVKKTKILILGVTFKENCSDIRNTIILDIYHTIKEYTNKILIYDPLADKNLIKKSMELIFVLVIWII